MEAKKIKLGRWLVIAGIAAVLLVLWSCKGEIAITPTGTEKKEEALPPPTEEELEGKETKLVWSYDPTGKRNPFELPKQTISAPSPITAYPLDQMWIDGIIIAEGGNNVAHIILPDRTDYFVKVGTIIGINSGVVKEIKADGIVVEEQYLDPVDPTKIRIVDKFLRMETESPPQVITK